MFSFKFFVIGLIFALNSVLLYASQFKDPTEPPKLVFSDGRQHSNGGNLLVTSIIISQIGRRAVVNGVVVRKGDAIDGEMVTEIRPNWVEVSQNGKLRKLYLVPLKIKKIVN